jgi:hypothetical protein
MVRLWRSRDPRGDGGEARRVRCSDCGAKNLPKVRCGCTFRHVAAPAAVLAYGSGDREERARARARALTEETQLDLAVQRREREGSSVSVDAACARSGSGW